MKKTITIAIPVYNGEAFISEAIQSIIDQSYKVDKILICDNQSTDDTIKIINQFVKTYPKFNIQLHQNKVNIGGQKNFNKCMELCETDFLLILGSDDRLKPSAIEIFMDFYNENPDFGLVGAYTDFINEKGQITQKFVKRKDITLYQKGEFLEYIEDTNLFMQHSTVMLNSKLIKQLGYWEVGYIGSDERYYVKVLESFPIARIGEAIVDQRLHTGQAVRNENSDFKGRIKHFTLNMNVAELETDPTRRRKSRRILKKWVSDYCRAIINLELKDGGNVSLATRYWVYGITHNPGYFTYVYSRKARHGIQKILGIKY